MWTASGSGLPTEARCIAYIFVVVPDKHTVYAEHMPAWVNRIEPRTRLDQLSARVADVPRLAFIDLRQALISAKAVHQVYYQHDTHWNDFGAFAGYREIMRYTRVFFPEAPVIASDQIAFESRTMEGDLARMLHLADLMPDEAYNARFSAHRPGRTENLRLLIVGDSFAEALIPYFSWSFGKVVRAIRGGYGDLPEQIIEEEKPDVVVIEMAERYL